MNDEIYRIIDVIAQSIFFDVDVKSLSKKKILFLDDEIEIFNITIFYANHYFKVYFVIIA